MTDTINRQVSIPLRKLTEKLSGKWTDEPPEFVSGVKIDSRSIEPGELFVGLPGEQTHGQRFVEEVSSSGGQAAIVEERQPADLPQLVVRDSGRALRGLAREFRKLDPWREVVGVTGSSGKTTTREMLGNVLRSLGVDTGMTRGNRNNHLGLPLTLLNHREADFLVAEVGINQVNEMQMLRDILRPSFGLITTVGPSHIEGLKEETKVAREKAVLLEGLAASRSVVGARDYREQIQDVAGGITVVEVEPGRADSLKLTAKPTEGRQRTWEIPDPNLPEPFQHNAMLVVATVGLLGENPAEAVPELRKFEPMKGRGRLIKLGKLRIIDGSYNANPQSMRSSLRRLNRLESPRYGILGTMKELGDESPKYHRELAKFTEGLDLKKVWFVGEYGELFKSNYRGEVEWVSGREELPDLPVEESGSVLVKASHSVGLHQWLEKQVNDR